MHYLAVEKNPINLFTLCIIFEIPCQTMCFFFENKILCVSRVNIYLSSHAQLLNKEMIIQGINAWSEMGDLVR